MTSTVRCAAVVLKTDSTQGWWGLSEAIGNGLQLLKSRTGPLVDYTTVPPTPALDRSRVVMGTAGYAKLVTDGVLPPATGWASDAAMWIAPLDLKGLDSLRRAGIGLVPFPIGPGSGATTPLDYYDAFAISAGTPHPQAAWEWLLYLQAHPAADEAHFTGLPPRRQLEHDMQLPGDHDARDAIGYALEHAQRPAPLRPEEYLVSEQLSQALSRIVDGGQPVPAALKEAQAAAEQQLSGR